MIYFITDDIDIKIGYTKHNGYTRLGQLQTGNARRLRLVHSMAGGFEEEQYLHIKFSHLKLTGEWFKFAPEIKHFINELKKQPSVKDIIDGVVYDSRFSDINAPNEKEFIDPNAHLPPIELIVERPLTHSYQQQSINEVKSVVVKSRSITTASNEAAIRSGRKWLFALGCCWLILIIHWLF